MLVNWNLKRTVKSQPLHELPAEVLRANFEKPAPEHPPAGVSMTSVDDGPVKGEWHRADKSAAGLTILYLHGGGYYFGSPKAYRKLTFALAQECHAEVFSLDYRQAPEAPFPAAVDDAVAAYEWLLAERRDPSRLFLAGDSAGGGLAMALMLSIRERGLPMPAGAVLYSPWTDMAVSGASLDTNEPTDVMFKKLYIVEGAKQYLNGADPKNPLASPLYGELAGLPPILTYASASEVLLDDATRLHEKLVAAGVEAKLVVEKGLAHIWPLFVGAMPESMKTIRQTAAFIRGRFNLNRVK